MKKYILAFLLVLISSSILWGSSKESWVKYDWGESGIVFLPKVFNIRENNKPVITYLSTLRSIDALGLYPYLKGREWIATTNDGDFMLDHFSISSSSSSRIMSLPLQDAEQITSALNEEYALKYIQDSEYINENIRFSKSVKTQSGAWLITYMTNTKAMEFVKIRYVIALHKQSGKDNIAIIRFIYYSSSPDVTDEHLALIKSIISKWELTPPGPYIEVPFVAIPIISAYLLVWSGLLIKRLCRKDQGRSTAPAYPHCLRHLETFKGRLAYCPMFLLPFLFDAGRYLYPSELLGMALVALILGTVVLSVLHLIAKEWKPWGERGKPFRVTVFMMGAWVVFLLSYVSVLRPRGFVARNFWGITLLPVGLGALGSFIYQKYIK